MATKTLGTLATTTLTGVQIPPDYTPAAQISDADWRTINNAILDDSRNTQRVLTQFLLPGAFARAGLLYIPNRGILRCQPGDWVAYDPMGWPVLIGKRSLPQVLTATANLDGSTAAATALSANVLALGWAAGMAITGTGVAASTVINAIASDGLSLTLSKASTAPETGTTLTVGSWTHS